jgi:hypothetical protein
VNKGLIRGVIVGLCISIVLYVGLAAAIVYAV